MPPCRRTAVSAVLLTICVVLAVVARPVGAETAAAPTAPPAAIQATPAQASAPATVPQSRAQVQLSFAPLAKQAMPAVVNIYTRKVVRTASPLLQDPFFRQFFGDMPGMTQERIQRSLGSGVIVRPDGLVVTNFHVVKESDAITVVLADRREFEASVVGTDDRTDLAVLKIDAAGEALPTLQLGDSDKADVGDLVLAIGNPYGVGQTVTMGIVSALARTQVGVGEYRSFIQTDAAINPGNSGGALVGMDGKLLGINTAIYSGNGGSVGIGFAIPTTLVQAVLNGITHGGKLVRPWLGASGQAVTADMAQGLRLPRPIGVILKAVYPGGPAAQAGLKSGDVIVAVNGREVDDPDGLRFRLATLAVGTQAQLTVVRAGQELALAIPLVAPPDLPARDKTDVAGRNPLSGATVANLNPALADEIGADTTQTGVVVVAVRPGTVAERLQLRPGDVMVKINDRAIKTVADLREAVAQPAPVWKMVIKREGTVMTLTVAG